MSTFGGFKKPKVSEKHPIEEETGDSNGGVFCYTRALSEDFMALPVRLGKCLLYSRKTEEIRKALQLFLTSACNDEWGLSLHDTVQLVFEPQWSVALGHAKGMTEFDLLHLRIDALQVLIQASVTDWFVGTTLELARYTWRQYLTMWLTAHVPLHIWYKAHPQSKQAPRVRHPSMRLSVGMQLLPDISGVIQSLDFNNVFGSKVVLASAFAHIMSKALPRRCQIRELSRFLLNYFSSYPSLQLLFDRMLLLSFVGTYPVDPLSIKTHWIPPWDFETLVDFYSLFLLRNDNETKTSDILLRHGDKDKLTYTQTLFFCVIRELLLCQVQTMPALQEVLCDQPGWTDLDGSVSSTMRQMRLHLHNLVKHTGKLSWQHIQEASKFLHQHISKSRCKVNISRKMNLAECLQRVFFLMHKSVKTLSTTEWSAILTTLREYKEADAIKKTNYPIVVIAGKGHEKFQIIKNKKIDFSDKKVVMDIN